MYQDIAALAPYLYIPERGSLQAAAGHQIQGAGSASRWHPPRLEGSEVHRETTDANHWLVKASWPFFPSSLVPLPCEVDEVK